MRMDMRKVILVTPDTLRKIEEEIPPLAMETVRHYYHAKTMVTGIQIYLLVPRLEGKRNSLSELTSWQALTENYVFSASGENGTVNEWFDIKPRPGKSIYIAI